MWFDGIRQPNTLYVLDSSRGKDSTACLRAIKILGWPLDAVICADMWATKDIPAARPEMVAYQDEWDATCEALFGVPVLKPYAKKPNGEKLTYEDLFYRPMKPKQERERERERAARMGDARESVLHGRTQNCSITDFQCREETGAHPSSKSVPYGFPISSKNGGNWCTTLKTTPQQAPGRGADKKYRPLYRNCSR